ncbi:hypothetical protein [Polycladidibacter stylochi]|uniref:hypothetical protein n=1 Tax=Polycladidibacter stylochi TaxID=1807766 RepID=UPI00083125CA|nr:hypothetical protein [Pseudovibrio stylochi]
MLWVAPLSVLLALCVFFYLTQLPPTYYAKSRIAIDASTAVLHMPDGASLDRLTQEADIISEQNKVLGSDVLMQQALRTAKLDDSTVFPNSIRSAFENTLNQVGIHIFKQRLSPDAQLLERFKSNLQIAYDSTSKTIIIGVSAHDKATAMRLANAMASEYLYTQNMANRFARQRLNDNLAPRIQQIKRMIAAENAVQARLTQLQSKMKRLESKAAKARALDNKPPTLTPKALREKQQLTSRLQRLQLFKSNGFSGDGIDLSFATQLTHLLAEKGRIEARIRTKQATLLPAHPQMIALNENLQAVKVQIAETGRAALTSIETQIAQIDGFGQAREAQNAAFAAQTAAYLLQDEKQTLLMQELDNSLKKLAALTSQLVQLEDQQNAQGGQLNARLVAKATKANPKYNNAFVYSAIAFALCFITGCLVVLAKSYVSGAFRRQDSLPQEALAVPDAVQAKGTTHNSQGSKDIVHSLTHQNEPHSGMAEQEKAVKRIVVLTIDSEALSSHVAAQCSRRLAERGIMPLRVEVSDSKAQLSQQASDNYGFAELLEGSAAFAQVIYRDSDTRAHIIPHGQHTIEDDAILSGRYQLIMQALDATYDVIVADLGLMDASLIGAQMLAEADRVIIASDGSPAGPELEDALSLLKQHCNAPIEVERINHFDGAHHLAYDIAA